MTKLKPVHTQIFKTGSKTYFNSSLFFPKNVREDVFIFYAWVRVADNFVDSIPQDRDGFYTFQEKTYEGLKGKLSGDDVIDSFVQLSKEKKFPLDWIKAFLHSMELDLKKSQYDSLEETLEYIYGSAEVIGLFMCKILNIPEEAYPYACMMGRNMQYINFIRDLDEDQDLGRRYIPLNGFNLPNLEKDTALSHAEEFKKFILGQTDLYMGWQKEAEKGYAMIPKRYLVAIKTASDMYNWTAREIRKDPLVVFRKKVKPSKIRIFWQLFKNLFYRGHNGKNS